MNYPTARGYYVRIYAISAQLLAGKFFGITKWSSWEVALAQAILWRNEFIQKLGPEVRLANGKNPPFQTTLSKKNHSGVTGVYYARNPDRGTPRPCWVASWCDSPKKPRVKRFLISRYGFEKAKRLAVRYRAERVAEIEASRKY